MSSLNNFLICNIGTLLHSKWAQAYPRHMVLAQAIASDPIYEALVVSLAAQPDVQVILDNGAYEDDAPMVPEEYLAITRSVKPWCVVAPDYPGMSSIRTREVSMDFAAQLPHYVEHAMYVPQGTSCVEVLDEYDWAAANLPPERWIIGIGKAYQLWGHHHTEVGRVEMVKEIMMHEGVTDHQYHVLGARWHPTKKFAECDNIVSIDSYKPCRCAVAHPDGPLYPRPTKYKMSHASNATAPDTSLSANVRAFCKAYGVSRYG